MLEGAKYPEGSRVSCSNFFLVLPKKWPNSHFEQALKYIQQNLFEVHENQRNFCGGF